MAPDLELYVYVGRRKELATILKVYRFMVHARSLSDIPVIFKYQFNQYTTAISIAGEYH